MPTDTYTRTWSGWFTIQIGPPWTWTQLHDATSATWLGNNLATVGRLGVYATVQDKWRNMARGGMMFNVTSLPANITSVKIKGTAAFPNSALAVLNLGLYNFVPADI